MTAPEPDASAGKTSVEVPDATDAENAASKPPNCPLVDASPVQIDCSVASATLPPT